MDIDVKTSISKQGSKVHNIKKKILGNKYELEIALEDKVYLETLQTLTRECYSGLNFRTQIKT
jgi:hypothetical protein